MTWAVVFIFLTQILTQKNIFFKTVSRKFVNKNLIAWNRKKKTEKKKQKKVFFFYVFFPIELYFFYPWRNRDNFTLCLTLRKKCSTFWHLKKKWHDKLKKMCFFCFFSLHKKNCGAKKNKKTYFFSICHTFFFIILIKGKNDKMLKKKCQKVLHLLHNVEQRVKMSQFRHTWKIQLYREKM